MSRRESVCRAGNAVKETNNAAFTAYNLPLYTFNYLGKEDLHEGVMAQDVLNVMPAAVSVANDGYYRVNYDMLGIELRRLPAV